MRSASRSLLPSPKPKPPASKPSPPSAASPRPDPSGSPTPSPTRWPPAGTRPSPTAVVRLVVARTLGALNLVDVLEHSTEQRVTQAFSANVDDMLAAAADIGNRAGAILTASYAVLGNIAIGEAFNGRAPAAAATWAEARGAVVTLDSVMRLWDALAHLTGRVAISNRRYKKLVWSPLTLDEFEQLEAQAGPWEILKVGGRIDVAADAETYPQRIAAVVDAAAERTARREASKQRPSLLPG